MLTDYGLNEKQLQILNKKGFYSSSHYARVEPKTYHDYRTTVQVSSQYTGKDIAILGTLEKVSLKKKDKFRIVTATVKEYASKRYIYISWFGFEYFEKANEIPKSSPVIVGGILKYNYEGDFYFMEAPFLFSSKIKESMRIIPEYGSMKHFTADEIEELHNKCNHASHDEFIPPYIKDKYFIMQQDKMKDVLYHAQDESDLRKAKYRIVFEHLLYHAIKMEESERKYPKGSPFHIKTIKNTIDMITNLPYKLTKDQRDICEDIKKRIYEGRRINALVQGDVGSGKTMVALISMLMMADNGYQSVLMAPTCVLARQHYEELAGYANKYGYKVAFIGGKQKAAEKKKILKGIKDGSYQFIIGTHGVFSKNVEYKNLGMVITDEEHRFGVLQREAVTEKVSRGIHTITMSATPIPRTIASVLYGDSVQVYTIKEKPAGRQAIKTTIFNKDAGIFKFIENQIKEGHQAYVVCPLIEKAEKGSVMERILSVEETKELYEQYFEGKTFLQDGTEKSIRIGCVSGKMTEEKAGEILNQFKQNEIQILIATTVVEVGVNVPNANVIVINDADRFGMAALHQLRGRVGRGNIQSYCILKSNCIQKEDKVAEKRLKTICETEDGFEIALSDLRNRGTGDLTGTKQSGDNIYMDLMLEYKHLYEKLRKEAAVMCDNGTSQDYILAYKKTYDIKEEGEDDK